ncbi:hypothetical protein [Acidovorax sp. RAC01]|uniref:hypothetical protein n=1 Tax=Acidovorax sp. RAC01 TaxID=1842533 RepID=UPI0012E99DAE|nr:hypothetical protein [Acidovorax sp. RAC01]
METNVPCQPPKGIERDQKGTTPAAAARRLLRLLAFAPVFAGAGRRKAKGKTAEMETRAQAGPATRADTHQENRYLNGHEGFLALPQ